MLTFHSLFFNSFNVISRLYSLKSVKPSDSGNYTCSPANLKPASVYIHVMDEDLNQAAIHEENSKIHEEPKSEGNSKDESQNVSSAEGLSFDSKGLNWMIYSILLLLMMM